MNIWGVHECMGAYKHRGHPDTPKYKKLVYLKKSRKNPI